MKHLVAFSLKRRFNNKAVIFLNILLIIMIGTGLFVDKVLLMINPDMFEPLVVYIDENLYDKKELFSNNEKIELKLYQNQEIDNNTYILKNDGIEWVVESIYPMSIENTHKIYQMIHNYTQEHARLFIDSELITLSESLTSFNLTNKTKADNIIDTTKQNLIFVVITTIYFMMLSYSSMIANEVVYEKTSKILELILTSVTAKTHFISKMLIGWLTIMIQTLITGVIIMGWLVIRLNYDDGSGLMVFAYKLGLLNEPLLKFKDLLLYLNIDSTVLIALALSLVFLILGILLLQMIMVIVSSFVNNIEESSNIQAPCYLILLAIYYFAISINTPYHMSEGMGYYLSFVPFFSMLFMPCRLLIQNIASYEIMISLVFAIIAILLVLDFGLYFYKQGILDNKRKKKKITTSSQ
ncbi:MAG: ABC transporter permease [Erysipelotrichaceae bacterium]|nr:ABC transporter permease [Erysipelotrichaceae bacterium]